VIPGAGFRSRRLAAAAVAVILTAGAAASPGSAAGAAPGPQRIVAVGDVHGDLDGLVSILEEAGIADATGRWVGGGATLVQLGDLLDRGTRLREVLDLLMRLEAEAPRAGGRVIVLLGNHEAMNLFGITRDVNRDAWAAFAGEHGEQRRAAALAAFRELWVRRMTEVGRDPTFTDEAAAQWLAMHPPGFVEYSEAFGPSGRYGAWLRRRPLAVILGETLFVHGGYGPALEGTSVDEINRRAAAELASFDATRSWMVSEGLALPWSSAEELVGEAQRELDWIAAQEPGTVPPERVARATRLALNWGSGCLMGPDGPVWFRSLATWDELEHGAQVDRLLDGLGVARQVVGHNPQPDGRIRSRFSGRVLLIDTGMLAAVYGGRPAALEIVGDTLTAIYPGERHALAPQPRCSPAAATATPAAAFTPGM